jgi:hypothetical protein
MQRPLLIHHAEGLLVEVVVVEVDHVCGLGPQGTHAHIMFTCTVARFLWRFVQEVLGPDWQAQYLGEFLENRVNATGKKICLFWMEFDVMSWTL